MKALTTIAILGALAILAIPAKAGCYQDGFVEGTTTAEDLWNTIYGADCNNIFDFTTDAVDNLINGQFKEENGDNWCREIEKRGACKAVEEKISFLEEECLDISMCQLIGESAAEVVIADFCSKSRKGASDELLMCRSVATSKCKGDLYTKMEEWLAIPIECPAIDNDISKFTIEMLVDLQEAKCPEIVDKLIGFEG